MKKTLSEPALEKVAERFRLLGEVTRLKLLAALREGEQTVNELAEKTGLSQTNTSRHLQALTQAGITKRRKDGLFAFYGVCDPHTFDLCCTVCECLESHLQQQMVSLQPQKKHKRRSR